MVNMFSSMNTGLNQSGNYFQSINQKYGCGEIDFGKYAYERPFAIEMTPRDKFDRSKESLLHKFYRHFIK